MAGLPRDQVSRAQASDAEVLATPGLHRGPWPLPRSPDLGASSQDGLGSGPLPQSSQKQGLPLALAFPEVVNPRPPQHTALTLSFPSVALTASVSDRFPNSPRVSCPLGPCLCCSRRLLLCPPTKGSLPSPSSRPSLVGSGCVLLRSAFKRERAGGGAGGRRLPAAMPSEPTQHAPPGLRRPRSFRQSLSPRGAGGLAMAPLGLLRGQSFCSAPTGLAESFSEVV